MSISDQEKEEAAHRSFYAAKLAIQHAAEIMMLITNLSGNDDRVNSLELTSTLISECDAFRDCMHDVLELADKLQGGGRYE